MSLAIVMTAWRRPEYTFEALRSIRQARKNGEPVFVSLDRDSSSEMLIRQAIVDAQLCLHFIVNDPPVGLWVHNNAQYVAFEWAFLHSEVDAILAMDDDCVFSPDALDLCHWYLEKHATDYLFLSVANSHRNMHGRELEVWESTQIDSPWCWCFTRLAWEGKIRPIWHCKSEPPVGWDWSLTYAMWKNGWKSLVPALPRAKNIGRELAANGGGEAWDTTFKGVEVSDGTWGNDFRLVFRNPVWWKEWMRPEALREGLEPPV